MTFPKASLRVRAQRAARALSGLEAFCAALCVAFTLLLLRFAFTRSTFFGDDLTTFWSFHRRGFPDWLFALLGGQFVPLHRAVSFLAYRLAPMSFGVALVILGAFHGVGIIYLYRSLSRLRETRMNAVLVAFYATYVFIGIQFTWFSSGLTRFPYIALSLVAIFHYLSFVRCGGGTRHLVWVWVAGALSLGFYAKGILVPLTCVCADLAAPGGRVLARRDRLLKWVTILSLVGLGVAYTLFARGLLSVSPLGRSMNVDLAFQRDFQRGCWAVLFHSLLDHVVTYGATASRAPAVPWVLLAAYASWRAPASLRAVLLGALLVTINFAVVGMSSRTLVFKGFMVYERRHYFEVCFPFFLFLGIALHGMRDAPEVRWALSKPAAGWVVAALLSLHVVASFSGLRPMLNERFYADMPRARAFLTTLTADLTRVNARHARRPTFVDGTFPGFLDPLDLTFRRYSELFTVLGVAARFEPVSRAEYVVGPDGHVRRVPRGPSRKAGRAGGQ